MKHFISMLGLSIALFTASHADAAPPCDQRDNVELCRISVETLADNPSLGQVGSESAQGALDRTNRHAGRRAKVRGLLSQLADPTWRDLYRAGYVISYGETPEEDLLAHAIAIRTLSLAPSEPDARFLVAMTIDAIGRKYVGAQLYGRQRYFEINPATGVPVQSCLPQMIEPPLPDSIGRQFHQVDGVPFCPPGVGVIR